MTHKFTDSELKRLQVLAQDLYAVGSDDDIEVDPLTGERDVSCGENGIWVRMWGHISNDILEESGIENPEAP